MVSYTMLCVPVSSSSLCGSDDYHTPSRNYNDSDSPLICCQYQIRIVSNNKHHTHKRYIWCSWCTQTKHCCNSTAEQQTQTCTSHTPLPISAIAWVCMCAACIRIVHVCSNILYVFYAGKWRYYKPHGLLSISAFQFLCTSLSAKKKQQHFLQYFLVVLSTVLYEKFAKSHINISIQKIMENLMQHVIQPAKICRRNGKLIFVCAVSIVSALHWLILFFSSVVYLKVVMITMHSSPETFDDELLPIPYMVESKWTESPNYDNLNVNYLSLSNNSFHSCSDCRARALPGGSMHVCSVGHRI